MNCGDGSARRMRVQIKLQEFEKNLFIEQRNRKPERAMKSLGMRDNINFKSQSYCLFGFPCAMTVMAGKPRAAITAVSGFAATATLASSPKSDAHRAMS